MFDWLWIIIPLIIAAIFVYKKGITISNVFYGCGILTGLVTIIYFLGAFEIAKGSKTLLLFLAAVVLLGAGYYASKKSK
jgi:hypothetical protein